MNIYKKVLVSIGLVIALCLMFCCNNHKAPTVPDYLTVKNFGENLITLEWYDNSTDEKQFLVYENDLLIMEIESLNPELTEKVVLTIAFNKYDEPISYKVVAVNDNGESVSNVFIYFESNPIAYAPFNFEAIPAFHKIKLTWEDTTKGDKLYRIFRDGHSIKAIKGDKQFIDSTMIDLATEYEYKIKTMTNQDSSEFVILNIKTHGEWRAIWDQSENTRGYNLYLTSSGLPSLIYSGLDTTFIFYVGYFPCAMVGAWNHAGEGLSEVVCAKVE